MTEDILLPFDLPAVSRKKVTADFGGAEPVNDFETVTIAIY